MFEVFLHGHQHKIDVFKTEQTLVKEGDKIAGGGTLICELCFAPFLSQELKQVIKLLHEHFNAFYITFG